MDFALSLGRPISYAFCRLSYWNLLLTVSLFLFYSFICTARPTAWTRDYSSKSGTKGSSGTKPWDTIGSHSTKSRTRTKYCPAFSLSFPLSFFTWHIFRVQTLGQNWEGNYCLRIAHLPSNDLNVFSGLTDYNVAWWVRPYDLQLGWWQHARRICSEDRNRKEREESRSSLCVTNP